MPPLQSVSTDPANVGISALLALLFLLLAAFPSQLFNKTLEENYAEVVGWFTRGGQVGVRIRDALAGFWQRRSGLILFVALSALLYGFLSPQFGPTIESFAALIGILAGLAIVIGAFELPLLIFQRRMNKDAGRLRVQPLTIFIGIACVVISRIADFQPGYLYGLVAAYAFARELPLRDEGRANAVTAIWMLGVALGAWLLLPFSEDVLTSMPLVQMAIAAALATIFVGGLGGAPVRDGAASLPPWRRGLRLELAGVGLPFRGRSVHVRAHPPEPGERLPRVDAQLPVVRGDRPVHRIRNRLGRVLGVLQVPSAAQPRVNRGVARRPVTGVCASR